MIISVDPTELPTAKRIVEIQQSAYAVEAALIEFDGIPQLAEGVEDVRQRDDLTWRGVLDGDDLAGIIAWEDDDGVLDIDRLAVDPQFARRGHGRALVSAVPAGPTIVSTGAKNEPALALYRSLGFEVVGDVEIAPAVSLAQLRRTN